MPTITVNQQQHTVNAAPETPLLYVLRNDLQLKSPKYGCGLEQCGACKVIIDGEAVPTCRLPVSSVINSSVTTLEHLAQGDALDPIQEAFVTEQAAQCGYCTAGFIMATKALLDHTPHPTEDEIRTALAVHLCRCGSYDRIIRAVKRAAGMPVPDAVTVDKMASMTADHTSSELPAAIRTNPVLDNWVRFNVDGTVTLLTGKVEIGQGIWLAVTQIGAEELGVPLDCIRVEQVNTVHSPDEGYTAGSNSIEGTGTATRQAAAEARAILLGRVATEWDVDIHELSVENGIIRHLPSQRQTDYWSLQGGQRLDCAITGLGVPKNPDDYTIVGQSAIEPSLQAKVTGAPYFVHDLALPEMVHGRVIRPPIYNAQLLSLDEEPIYQLDGILKVVRDGSFLGVIAEREEQAIAAAEMIEEQAEWSQPIRLPDVSQIYAELRTKLDQPLAVIDGVPTPDVPIPPITGDTDDDDRYSANYTRPYHMHGSLGPSTAAAMWQGGKLTVWCHTQGVYPLKGAIAQVLDLSNDQIDVTYMPGAGCYGHNGADDVALDVSLLALAFSGRPILLKWMRADEHRWEPYGPAMAIEMRAGLNEEGTIDGWRHDVWSYTHMGRPRAMEGELAGTSNLLAAWYLQSPTPPPVPKPGRGYHGGIHRNADPLYAFPEKHIIKHFVPDSPLRVSALRTLGAFANTFAIESFMDELAHQAQIDPIEFRLQHLADERAKAVLKAVAVLSGWSQYHEQNIGKGVGFAQYKNQKCYAAVVVDVAVDPEAKKILLKQVYIAADAGQVINPDRLASQLEGGVVQGASWVLKEAVRFSTTAIESVDWESYPILTIEEAPPIQTHLLDRPDCPSVGAGEATPGPTAAAIANAIFDATGIRLRDMPLTL